VSLGAAIAFTILGVAAGFVIGLRFAIRFADRGWKILLCRNCYARVLGRIDKTLTAIIRGYPTTKCSCGNVLLYEKGVDAVAPRLHELLDSLEDSQAIQILEVLNERQKGLLELTVQAVNGWKP
jgi:hypothetical protein